MISSPLENFKKGMIVINALDQLIRQKLTPLCGDYHPLSFLLPRFRNLVPYAVWCLSHALFLSSPEVCDGKKPILVVSNGPKKCRATQSIAICEN